MPKYQYEQVTFDVTTYRRAIDHPKMSMRIYFRSGGTYETCYLHRAVWCKANGVKEVPEGMQVHHKDGNYLNNHPDNLELISPKEHRKRHNQEELSKLKTCETCGKSFRSKSPKSTRCSSLCKHSAFRERKRAQGYKMTHRDGWVVQSS